MPAGVLGAFSVPHRHGVSEEHQGRFEIKGPKHLKKDVERLDSYVKGGRVLDAIADFCSTQYKNIAKLVSSIAKIVELSAPNTPAGSMAGRVSAIAGDVKNAISVIELPKKLIEVVKCVEKLTENVQKGNVTEAVCKIAELIFKKMAELINALCDGLSLLDRHVVSIGSPTMKTVKGVGGVATLAGAVYSLIFENIRTLITYWRNRNEENADLRPTTPEWVALGFGGAQNVFFTVLGSLLVATGLGAAVLSIPWIIFAFSTAGFACVLTVYFIERIWAREMQVSWVPAAGEEDLEEF